MGAKDDREVLLFQGQSIYHIHKYDGVMPCNNNELVQIVKRNKKILCLLASPLVITYVHETIHLKKNELLDADQQILSLSRIPYKNRKIESIQLSEKKAITLHAHLSKEGEATLSKLNKIKKNILWQAAIPYFVRNLLQYPQLNLRKSPIFRCFLEEEAFEIVWKPSIPFINLVQNWRPEKNPAKKEYGFRKLLNVSNEQRSSLEISFHHKKLDNISLASLNSLVFPDGILLKHKTVIKSGSKPGDLLQILKPRYLIIFVCSLVSVWLIAVKIEHHQLLDRKNRLYSEMTIKKNGPDLQQRIVNFERKYFQESVLSELILSERFRLDRIILKIEEFLDGTQYWLSEYHGNNSSITLSFVKSGSHDETKIQHLLRRFQLLGETKLIGSDRIVKKGFRLIEYQIKIVFRSPTGPPIPIGK